MGVGASSYHTPKSVPQSNDDPPPLSNDPVGDDADSTTRLIKFCDSDHIDRLATTQNGDVSRFQDASISRLTVTHAMTATDCENTGVSIKGSPMKALRRLAVVSMTASRNRRKSSVISIGPRHGVISTHRLALRGQRAQTKWTGGP